MFDTFQVVILFLLLLGLAFAELQIVLVVTSCAASIAHQHLVALALTIQIQLADPMAAASSPFAPATLLAAGARNPFGQGNIAGNPFAQTSMLPAQPSMDIRTSAPCAPLVPPQLGGQGQGPKGKGKWQSPPAGGKSGKSGKPN